MRRSMKFRPQANQIEAITKRNTWSSLAIVGVADSEVMQRMLFACTRLALTVVATWPAQSTQPTERIKQKSRADKVRQLARSYASRVTLLECDADTAAGKLAGQEFDGAVLFDAPDLEHDGGAWAALVRSGGMLLGTDHRDMATRATLNAVAPGWERLDDGLWCVRVKRAVHDEVRADDVGDAAIAPVGADVLEPASGDRGEVRVEADVDRPKKRASRPPLPPEIAGSDTHAASIAPKRRGGRPKGSKNKTKVEV
jgi:hypothetical protein